MPLIDYSTYMVHLDSMEIENDNLVVVGSWGDGKITRAIQLKLEKETLLGILMDAGCNLTIGYGKTHYGRVDSTIIEEEMNPNA